MTAGVEATWQAPTEPLTHSGHTVEWISQPHRFEAIAEQWDRLAATEGTPFSLHAWLAAWWAAFGEGDRMRVCVLWRGDTLVAGLPLAATTGGLAAMSNDHTPLLRPLAADAGARAALCAALLDHRAGQLVLRGLPDEPDLAALVTAAGERGRAVLIEPRHTSPIVDTSGEFEAWRGETKRRWGSPIERFRRKGQRENEGSLRIVEPPRELERELALGFEVEASGWKGRSGTAVLSDPRTARFYLEVARAFDRRGELRLSGLSLDGKLAAFDYSILHGNRLWLLKTGFDEAFRRLAPGLVLRLSIIERCFELGLNAHELLGGEDEWKLKFSTAERRHVCLRSYRRAPVPLARYVYRRRLRPPLRAAYRRLRPAA